MAKKKKPKKNIRRTFRSTSTKVPKIHKLTYTKVTVKWLPRTDEFQCFLDLNLNGTRLTMLGSIDPEKSYFEGIRVFCEKPQPWMSCNDIFLLRENAPQFFAGIKGYFHTIGDLLDDGEEIENLPTAEAYLDGNSFSDSNFLDHFKLIYPNGGEQARERLTSITQLSVGMKIEQVYPDGSSIEYQVVERIKGAALVSENDGKPFPVTFREFRVDAWYII